MFPEQQRPLPGILVPEGESFLEVGKILDSLEVFQIELRDLLNHRRNLLNELTKGVDTRFDDETLELRCSLAKTMQLINRCKEFIKEYQRRFRDVMFSVRYQMVLGNFDMMN